VSAETIKDEVKRRLFAEAFRGGNREPKFGYCVCPSCGGRGFICIEQRSNGVISAAMQECSSCKGEKIVRQSDL
jgi:DnaJ-class molecular chaperone